MKDYIHTVQGNWEQIKNHPIVETYTGFEKLNLSDVFFALNIQKLHPATIPTTKFKKIIISYHTEYFEHEILWNFFNSNPDCKFLFLTDSDSDTNIWPNNVTTCQWITWGQQLDVAVEYHSIADNPTSPKYKLSSLSNRHEFHKAAVTAFLLENVNTADMVLSWNNWCPTEPYYKNSGMFMPPEIQKYLNDEFHQIESIKLLNDTEFNISPVANGDWHHPAYIDCAINITNESVFNSTARINESSINLPTPYLTEKTWKPLLAGRPFIPIGQAGTLSALTQLGLNFDYNLDLSFDSTIPDFTRMIKIYNCLEHLISMSVNEIFNQTKESSKHNLEFIRSGNFRKKCDAVNLSKIQDISVW